MTSQNKVKSIFNFIRYRVILCFYNKTVLQAEQDIDQIVPAVISIFPAGRPGLFSELGVKFGSLLILQMSYRFGILGMLQLPLPPGIFTTLN